MLYIRNSEIEVGIRPDLGGRVMTVRMIGKENILTSDTNATVKMPETPLQADNFEFVSINGQTVWLGAQSDWWVQQDVATKRKAEKAVWPPDPYTAFGNYQVIEQRPDYIKMVSPESPIVGLQLTKEVRLEKNRVVFTVSARNCTQKELAWDLWLNMRLDGWASGYAAGTSDNIRIDMQKTEQVDELKSENIGGIFTFIPELPSNGKQQRTAKAFIYPSDNWIAGFDKGQMILLRAPIFPKEEMHPAQAPIEIYNTIQEKCLLELEYHSAHKRVKPNETMRAEQTWDLFEYSGKKDHNEHIVFIHSKIH